MPPSLVLLLWAVFVLGLLRFDPARYPKSSVALWVPVIWFFFIGSRTPSAWLGLSGVSDVGQALEQGNAFDRTVFSLLTLTAFATLVSRSFKWGKFVTQNSALAVFLAFALLSVAWSDFPLAGSPARACLLVACRVLSLGKHASRSTAKLSWTQITDRAAGT